MCRARGNRFNVKSVFGLVLHKYTNYLTIHFRDPDLTGSNERCKICQHGGGRLADTFDVG